MKKKSKMKGMLKGVAAAGIVAGGASAIPEADVVFAAELEESEVGSESLLDVDYLESASESASEFISESASDTAVESDAGSPQGRWVQECLPLGPEGQLRPQDVPEGRF